MYTIHDEQTQVVSCIRQMALNQENVKFLQIVLQISF